MTESNKLEAVELGSFSFVVFVVEIFSWLIFFLERWAPLRLRNVDGVLLDACEIFWLDFFFSGPSSPIKMK